MAVLAAWALTAVLFACNVQLDESESENETRIASRAAVLRAFLIADVIVEGAERGSGWMCRSVAGAGAELGAGLNQSVDRDFDSVQAGREGPFRCGLMSP
jgi:hypothetical protein